MSTIYYLQRRPSQSNEVEIRKQGRRKRQPDPLNDIQFIQHKKLNFNFITYSSTYDNNTNLIPKSNKILDSTFHILIHQTPLFYLHYAHFDAHLQARIPWYPIQSLQAHFTRKLYTNSIRLRQKKTEDKKIQNHTTVPVFSVANNCRTIK